VYVFYVDDSFSSLGDPGSFDPSGTPRFVHIAVGFELERWREALTEWLDVRHEYAATHELAKNAELHSADFLSGRGRFGSILPAGPKARIDRGKKVRRAVFPDLLQRVAGLPGITLLAAEAAAFGRQDSYRALLAWIETFLAEHETEGIIAVDGTDASYRLLHREMPLATRRILEDPWMKDSAHSQFLQIADFAGHALFQALIQRESRKYAWTWWHDHLSAIAVDGGGDCGIKTGL
jgi:hypothetical protein